MAAEDPSSDFYLHSHGRRFGPLTQDELRGYFRAGMVKSVDLVTVPGRAEPLAAAVVATMLGESVPVGPPPPTPEPATATTSRTSGDPELDERAVRALAALNMDLAAISAASAASASGRRSGMLRIVGAIGLLLVLLLGFSLASKLSALRKAPPRPAEVLVLKPGAAAGAGASAGDPTQQATPTPSAAAAAQDYFQRSNALAQAGDWNGLVSVASAWAELEPNRIEPFQHLGLAQAHLGNTTKAADALNRLLQIDPGNSLARSQLLQVYVEGKQWQAASDMYKDAVAADRGNARLWNDYGHALHEAGQPALAVAALETATRLDPSSKEAWGNLAKAYLANGDPGRASAARASANSVR
jgi:tetratricopeptide (TPR) repeat protein